MNLIANTTIVIQMITMILAPIEMLHGNEVDDMEADLHAEVNFQSDIENEVKVINDVNNSNINHNETRFEDNPLDINVDPEKTAKMRVEPKARSVDYAEAFENMRRGNPKANIYAIVDGISYDHIVSVEKTSNGTLLMVKTEYNGYEEEHVFKVEDIDKMAIRSSRKGSKNITIPKGWK